MRMRNFAISFLVILGAAYLVWSEAGYFKPCAKPIKYSISSVDPKFGLSMVEFLDSVEEAENIWEKTASKELFAYSPDASLKVNLIYDERQMNIIAKQRTESGLEAAEDLLKAMDAEFAAMKSEYERRATAYEGSLSALEDRQASYEAEVRYWNARGGAPKKEFEAMEEKRLLLNAEVQTVNAEAAALNRKSEELNALLQRRNSAAKSYNQVVESYNDKYASGLEFDQAEYTGKAINIYEFKNKQDLVLVLAHELGHALGLDHVENSKSIMYYLNGGQNEIILSNEDLAELNRICGIK